VKYRSSGWAYFQIWSRSSAESLEKREKVGMLWGQGAEMSVFVFKRVVKSNGGPVEGKLSGLWWKSRVSKAVWNCGNIGDKFVESMLSPCFGMSW
jgi:hypothetical protein